ncbi:MAG TPA: nitrilase-related carbon-nitrogen hydrolase [Polyangiaceae bacterium]|nr:nitrilase-related carbon-nitrogen hydrolase [Polyangiaceae bacterium]
MADAPEVPRAKKSSGANKDPRLIVRPLELDDLDGVQAVHAKAYPGFAPWSGEQLANHLRIFPEGQIGVEFDGKLVATSSSLIVGSRLVEGHHTYEDVCPAGLIDPHDPNGEWLYGIDIAVDPSHRGLHLARRIYDARKALVSDHGLRGMMFGGRMPGYAKHQKTLTPHDYLRRVLRKELRDPVITTQRANGFVARGVLKGYLPSDAESGGYAVIMEWLNPTWSPPDRPHISSVRVAAVQYEMRTVGSFEEFATQCEFFIDTASEYRADFLLFPELLTNQLLSLVPSNRPGGSARELDTFSTRYVEFFSSMAIKYNVNIVAGTHLTVENDTLFNICYLFHRDGRIDKQYKVHVTPSEARWWGVSPGRQIDVFETDVGTVACAICYDVEFPEYARITKAKGANILFVPYNTDIRSGHLRVRACAQARAIENHFYVVTAGATGNLPQVEGADIHYAQSAILTPSDIAFARDGIAAEATPNVETMLVHDLDLDVLKKMESNGTVHTWPDRRTDLYSVRFLDGTTTLVV